MTTESKTLSRCAIYSRKSSEEGLEQSFNSLDAQREACESFIASQRHEGWRALPARYDDGGYSGGDMERPGLRQLLEDVEANKVDTIVVYKVDRLTRSLSDFAKIVEALDAHGVSFVSVTQQFNTTTSMGRLTLNILLSFAQFEREVTGERIRDKIAASKRKGMWMGGSVPLGYDVKDRKLIVNPEEAKLVRSLFNRYLELRCVSRLKIQLDEEGLKSKVRISAAGTKSGGVSFARGGLYRILSNRIYLGEISHKGQCHPGEHEAIVPRELWDRVQAQLRSDNQGRRNGLKAQSPSLLTGLLQDAEGNRLTPSHAVKKGRRYRYYASQSAVEMAEVAQAGPFRLPAYEIEAQVLSRLAAFLRSEKEVMDQLGVMGDGAETTQHLLASAQDTSRLLKAATRAEITELTRSVVHRVVVHRDKVDVLMDKEVLRQLLLKKHIASSQAALPVTGRQSPDDLIHLEFAARLRRSGLEVRLVVSPESPEVAPRPQSQALLKAIARAHDWHEQLISGQASGPRSIAKQTGLDESYVRRILGYAFLAPDIVEAILNGRQPQDLTLEKLRKKLPMSWAEQRMILLPSAQRAGRIN
jgi:DNA invertase Pin-like site-specific DNA recombinase